jgi:hypothetical protein
MMLSRWMRTAWKTVNYKKTATSSKLRMCCPWLKKVLQMNNTILLP